MHALCVNCAAECKELFGRSLFFVGEFGVNDYHLSLKKRSVHQVRSFVPHVIRTISMAIEVSCATSLIMQQTAALLWALVLINGMKLW